MYQPNDKLAVKAKKEGYRARSVFKLVELDQKFGLLHQAMKVLDLGASPGSWLQYVSEKVGPRGKAIGLDLKEMAKLNRSNIQTFTVDVFDEEFLSRHLAGKEFDVVLSDMAPSTGGVKFADSALSLKLLDRAFQLARTYLKPGGNFAGKVFESHDLNRWFEIFSKQFRLARRFKPKACRAQSKELYVIGLGFKKQV